MRLHEIARVIALEERAARGRKPGKRGPNPSAWAVLALVVVVVVLWLPHMLGYR